MNGERYVLLGLGHVRAPWFSELARWSTSAMVPVEFVKAVSAEEVRVRLRSGRGFSALRVGDDVVGVDRDLIELAKESGCAVVVVTGGRVHRDWSELGMAASLSPGFGPADLVDVLAQVARPVARLEQPAIEPVAPPAPAWRGHLVAVTGSGGAGRSTVAIALAQGFGGDPRYSDLVCLADLNLRADQGTLHDVTDVVPSVVELVDAHRSGLLGPDDVRTLTWDIVRRGYHLLAGLRRSREWTALRPRAFETALDGLSRAFRLVVADVDDDLDGESSCGSIDVEERNLMARSTVSAADLVVAVGRPGVKGLHSLLRVARDLTEHGVPADRIVPVLNGVGRSPRVRAELTAAFGGLSRHSVPDLASPIFVPHRRRVEESLRDGTRLPEPVVAPLRDVVAALLARLDDPSAGPQGAEPVPVAPGSLGSWTQTEP
jgi:MinD-like ATPase involved in chromosome partitioning or flagellar assembly